MGFLTMPDPSCDNNPDPEPRGPDDSTVDVRRDRIDCMLDDSRNGTLVLDVFGIDPPWWRQREKIGWKLNIGIDTSDD